MLYADMMVSFYPLTYTLSLSFHHYRYSVTSTLNAVVNLLPLFPCEHRWLRKRWRTRPHLVWVHTVSSTNTSSLHDCQIFRDHSPLMCEKNPRLMKVSPLVWQSYHSFPLLPCPRRLSKVTSRLWYNRRSSVMMVSLKQSLSSTRYPHPLLSRPNSNMLI